jgi:hypothetical protein
MQGVMGYGYLTPGISGLGEHSRYRDSLRTGRSGERIPVGARFSIPGSHLSLCTMGAGSVGVDLPPPVYRRC